MLEHLKEIEREMRRLEQECIRYKTEIKKTRRGNEMKLKEQGKVEM